MASSGFGRILADLNRAEIRYVVIGGIAMIRYGVVRATKDVDVMLAPTEASTACSTPSQSRAHPSLSKRLRLGLKNGASTARPR